MAMTENLARFAKDSYYLLRSPHSASRKLKVWSHLAHPSGRMLGFEISYFDRPTLAFLYREIFARQNYYFRAQNEAPVVLDCGANLGMATLYFKWLYPKARIEAFEPDPGTFTLLERNVRRNELTDVVLHNCALWDETGNIEFFVDPAVPGSLLMSTDRTRLTGQPIRVPSQRLSSFVQQPIDFLKLDVEGAEHRVLCDLATSGAIKLVKEMVIEYHHRIGKQRSCLADFLRLLEQSGFEYQLHAALYPVNCQGAYQDILIAAYR